MNESAPETRPFRMEVELEDVTDPHAMMGVLAGTAEALCRASRSDVAGGFYCLIWAAIHIAQTRGVETDRILGMIADATALILSSDTDEATAGPGRH